MTYDRFHTRNGARVEYGESKFRKPKTLNVLVYPHAIMSTDGTVMLIRDYPTISRTNAIHVIEDGVKCNIGMRHLGKGKFL